MTKWMIALFLSLFTSCSAAHECTPGTREECRFCQYRTCGSDGRWGVCMTPGTLCDAGAGPDTGPRPDVGTDAWIDPLQIGQIATSCGAESQGLVPVDCTVHGDVDAYCVFGNHCACTTGFVCEVPGMVVAAECEPGSVCVPTP